MAEVTVKALKKSSAFVASAEVWRILSRFVMTPIIITKLGLEGYGTWVLLFSICAYVSMFNTSGGLAFSKYTAEYDKKGEYERLSELIGTGILIFGSCAIVALCGIWLFRIPIMELVNIPLNLHAAASDALLLVLLAVLLRMTFGCVFQVLAGLQRMDLQFKLRIFASLLELGIGVLLLLKDFGLVALAIGHLTGQLVATALAWYFCLNICPSLRVFPLKVSRSTFSQMFTLAGKFQLLSLLSTIYRHGINVLISGMCGITMLAMYDLANKLLRLGMTFSGAIRAPLMPAFANLHASESKNKRETLYLVSSKLVAFVAIVCFSGLVVFADLLIVVWTGKEFPDAAWTMRVMAIGNYLVLMTGVNTANLRSRGMVKLELIYSLICIILTSCLIFPANMYFGYQGVVTAITASLIVGSLWYLATYARQEGEAFPKHLGKILFSATLIGLFLSMIGLYYRELADNFMPDWSQRWVALFEASLFGFALAIVVGFILWYSLFSQKERWYLSRRLLGKNRRVRSPFIS